MSTIELSSHDLRVEATLIAGDLGLPPEQVLNAMRAGRLTAVCEQGIEQDAGLTRITFYHANRRLRLVVDAAGKVLSRSAARIRRRGGRP